MTTSEKSSLRNEINNFTQVLPWEYGEVMSQQLSGENKDKDDIPGSVCVIQVKYFQNLPVHTSNVSFGRKYCHTQQFMIHIKDKDY